MSPNSQTSFPIQSQDLHCKSPRLRTVLAQFAHGHHLEDRLISVSPDHRWTYRNVITVASSLVLSYRVAASKKTCDGRSAQSISASALVDHSLVHRIYTGALPDTSITARSTGVNRKDNGFRWNCTICGRAACLQRLCHCSARVHNHCQRQDRESGPPAFRPTALHVRYMPSSLSHLPNSYSSLAMMSQIEKKAQTFHAALEESSPARFESVYLSATYQTHSLES
jgi:hypothetical protein